MMIGKVFRFCENRLPEGEIASLYEWVNESDRNKILFAEIKNYYTANEVLRAKKLSYREREHILEQIYRQQGWYRRVVFRPKPATMALQVALSITVISSVLLGLVQLNRYQREREAMQYLSANIKAADKKAVLTLSTGDELVLGVKDNKSKSKQYDIEDDGSKVRIREAEVPKPSKAVAAKPSINTISTELGGYYTAVLPDGSEVWINSKSKITFPENFGKKERRVTLVGEAYFSVVKKDNIPFIVEIGHRTIEVLGTEFNVKAYNEEPIYKVSLVKGSVLYSDNSRGLSRQLSPERELVIDKASGDVTEGGFDPYIYSAWQSGYFLFTNENLDEIVKMMSRWFDIEIRLETDQYNAMKFNGKISRELGIMPLMSKLQMSYKFRYYMEDETLIIK